MDTRRTSIEKPRRIGIIGGGASAALFAIECRRRLDSSIELVIFDPSSFLGRGRAYAAPDRDDLLNVPAANMSARSDQPEDFVQWLRSQGRDETTFPHWPYVNRAVYGEYIADRLRSVVFTPISERVTSIAREGSGFAVTIPGQATERFDALIVATGYRSENLKRDFPPLAAVQGHVIAGLSELGDQDITGHVLVVGTGLTAIDFWRRFRNLPGVQVSFLSRRGLFPVAHENASAPVSLPQLSSYSSARLLTFIRQTQAAAQVSWPSVAIAIRSQATAIWTAWSEKERQRFLRHLKPYWEIIRHRVPLGVSQELENDLRTGRATVNAGRIKGVSVVNGRARLEIQLRHSSSSVVQVFDRIALATGAPIDQDLAFQDLNEIARCPYGFGFRGETVPGLWFIGPPSRSAHWEITALPDIREQVRRVVDELERS